MEITVYEDLDVATAAAKEMCAVLETYVEITKAENGYELFGTGAVVKTVKE